MRYAKHILAALMLMIGTAEAALGEAQKWLLEESQRTDGLAILQNLTQTSKPRLPLTVDGDFLVCTIPHRYKGNIIENTYKIDEATAQQMFAARQNGGDTIKIKNTNNTFLLLIGNSAVGMVRNGQRSSYKILYSAGQSNAS